MDKKVIEKYLNEVPFEIRLAVMELNTDAKWAVYISLITEGKKFFNEIKDEFNANPNTMTNVLKALVDGGLIARKSNFEGLGDKRKVFYEATNMGYRLFKTLNYVVVPPMLNVPERKIKMANYPTEVKIQNTKESDNAPKLLAGMVA